jgi:hypothetical protein
MNPVLLDVIFSASHLQLTGHKVVFLIVGHVLLTPLKAQFRDSFISLCESYFVKSLQ